MSKPWYDVYYIGELRKTQFPVSTIRHVQELRKKGCTLSEIAKLTSISYGTISYLLELDTSVSELPYWDGWP